MKNIDELKKECEKIGMKLEDILNYLQANLNHGTSIELLEFIGGEEKILRGGVFKEKVVSFRFLESETKEIFSLIIRHHIFANVQNETKIIIYHS